jgi:N-acyl-L-homoserine lactone synthetase
MSRDASTSPAEGGVAELDELARRLVAAAPELRVAVAAAGPERDAVHRLRRLQVRRLGWAAPDPAGRERDAYDRSAVHIGAWHGNELAGTVRLVLPASTRRLPVEAAFALDVEPRGAVVEVGRLVVAPAYRGDPAHRAWGALFGKAWLAVREHGFTVLAGAATPRMVTRLRALGLPFEVLAPARAYWGEERHPVRLEPASGSPRWYASPAERRKEGGEESPLGGGVEPLVVADAGARGDAVVEERDLHVGVAEELR